MSNVLRNLISPIAAIVAILAMGMATPARADLEIWASTTGPTTSANEVAHVASGTGFQSVNYTSTLGGFNIAALATSSNTPGTPTVGYLTGSTVTIQNNNASTATLWISLGDTIYNAPTGSVTVNSHIGGSVTINGAANMMAFQSYVNSDDSQNGTTGVTGGAQNPVITGPLSYTSDLFTPIASLSSPYSITETFEITLSAGSLINFGSNTTLTSVPEPSTMAIAGLGALGMIGYGLRRRKALGA
jgi:hypothetical protein